MSYPRVILAVLGALALAAARPAVAGIADSPLPVLESGKGTIHVYSVPGVVQLLNLETVFMCTSLERSNTARVAIEIFGTSGGTPANDVNAEGDGSPGNGAVDVNPGGTVTIATGNVFGFLQDETIIFLPGLKNGSARILSTSTKIMCTAFVTDKLSTPPTSMRALPIIKKTSQKGT